MPTTLASGTAMRFLQRPGQMIFQVAGNVHDFVGEPTAPLFEVLSGGTQGR
jgi:hypothetical protein